MNKVDQIFLTFIYVVSIILFIVVICLITIKIILPAIKAKTQSKHTGNSNKHAITVKGVDIYCDASKISVIDLMKKVCKAQDNMKKEESGAKDSAVLVDRYYFNDKLIVVTADLFGNLRFNIDIFNFILGGRQVFSKSKPANRSNSISSKNRFKGVE